MMIAVWATAATVGACSYLAPRSRVLGPDMKEDGVHFRFYAPSATRVQVAGDWPENNWARGDGAAGEANIGMMQDQDNDGVWELVVAIGPGRYRYLFLVDENVWRLDPGNPDEVDGGPARRASRLVVVSRNGRLEIH